MANTGFNFAWVILWAKSSETVDSLKEQLSLLESIEATSLTEQEKLHLQKLIASGESGVAYFGAGTDASEALEEFWGAGIPPAVHYDLRAARAALKEPHPDSGILYSRIAPDWYIGFSHEFLKSVSGIDRKAQGRVFDAIAKVSGAPITISGDTVKPLSGNLSGLWRVRVGDYRLVYFPHIKSQRITLLSYGPRGSVYDHLPDVENSTPK